MLNGKSTNCVFIDGTTSVQKILNRATSRKVFKELLPLAIVPGFFQLEGADLYLPELLNVPLLLVLSI